MIGARRGGRRATATGTGTVPRSSPRRAVATKFGDRRACSSTAGGYKIDAGRRERPGEVEYHEHVVDVMHVVQGTATVVTGGRWSRRAR